MPKSSHFLLATCLTTISLITGLQVRSEQYYYGSPATEFAPGTTDSSFSIHADSMSCSSGGGSSPSVYVGAHAGDDAYKFTDPFERGTNPSRTNGDFLSGTIGLNIPLGSPSNKHANCEKVLAVVEAEEFLKMVATLDELEILDIEKKRAIVINFLESTSKKLGVDLVSALKADFSLDTKLLK